MILPDKTTIHYWYKKPVNLIKHQLERILSAEQLDALKTVNFTIGGDHGGGKFVLHGSCFYVSTVKKFSHVFQIASVSQSKDDISILKATVLSRYTCSRCQRPQVLYTNPQP
jgi:hypothetical protein